MLELKVRTASAKRQRRRHAAGLLSKLVFVFLAIGLLAVGFRLAAGKFFYGNSEYSLRHLDAHLDGVMSREELVSLTGFKEGGNIFLLDLDQANRRLAALPEVRAATVERILPDTLRVELERRVPIFLLAGEGETGDAFLPGKSFLCDGEGVIFRPDRLDPKFLNLPFLRGLDLSGAAPGKPLWNNRLSFALTLQQVLSEIPEQSFKIRSIDISKSYAAVVTDESGARFTFGNDDLPGQISRLRKLLEHCQETGRRLDTANLMVARNTPVTFLLTPESSAPKIVPVGLAKKNSAN